MILTHKIFAHSQKMLTLLKYQFSKINKFTLPANKFKKQFDGFLIFENLKTKSIQKFGLILSLLGVYSGFVYFYLCDETSKSVYLPLIIMSAGALIAYQLKMRMTTKFITLDRRGELVMLVYYKWLGYSTKSRQVPVINMLGLKNYSRWLKIPSYGYRFNNKINVGLINFQGMHQQQTFNQIVKGNSIKIIGKVKQN